MQPLTSHTLADLSLLAFKIAFARWVSAPDAHDLAQLIREFLDQLKGMIARA